MSEILKLAEDPQRMVYIEAGVWSTSVSLDDLFVRNLRRAPDRIVLCDPPNKRQLTGSSPLYLTATEADSMIGALALRFQTLGLQEGDVVGVQMPNTAELPVTLLACMRCGLVPALLPLLWSERDILAALDTLNVRALVTMTHCGTLGPADRLRYAAASLFSVRYLMAFGSSMPDGVLSLNEAYNAVQTPVMSKVKPKSFSGKADTAAFITFRMTTHEPVPVVRSHNHAMSAALMPLLEAQMEPDDEVSLSTLQPASLAGLSTGFLSWLLSGGCLVLNHGADLDAICQQACEERATRLIIPGMLLPEMVSRLKVMPNAVKTVIAVQANAAAQTPAELKDDMDIAVIDGYALDEFAFVAYARDKGATRTLHTGPQIAPSNGMGPALCELGVSPSCRLTARGPSVPYHPEARNGVQQTGYQAVISDGSLTIAGRADRIAFIGGLAVSVDEIASTLLQSEGVQAVQVKAVSDPLFGEILEARLSFEQRLLPPSERIERLRADLEAQQIPAYKIPSRFIIDPLIVEQENTLVKEVQKKAV